MEKSESPNLKKGLIISIFTIVIFNFLIEAILVTILMNSPSYQGIGILGLNFTLAGGDIFFFFYNFLILCIIIMTYCSWKMFRVDPHINRNEKSKLHAKIALIVLISFLAIEIINIYYRFFLIYAINIGGMVILHFVLDLIYNISIIISYAALILTMYT